jgi:hypothetical protein
MFSRFIIFISKEAWKGYLRIQTRRLSCNSIEGYEQNKVWGNQNRRINIKEKRTQ